MGRAPLVVAVVAFLAAVATTGIVERARPHPGIAGPTAATPATAAAEPHAFRDGFRPLLEQAAANADALVVMGEARERNLLRIRASQETMNASLAAADDWLASHPAPATDQPAVAAYHQGAAAIRSAMDEALVGFLRFDFERVARATERMREGAAALREAIGLLEREPSPKVNVADPARQSASPAEPNRNRVRWRRR